MHVGLNLADPAISEEWSQPPHRKYAFVAFESSLAIVFQGMLLLQGANKKLCLGLFVFNYVIAYFACIHLSLGFDTTYAEYFENVQWKTELIGCLFFLSIIPTI